MGVFVPDSIHEDEDNYPEAVVVTVHGQESRGAKLDQLSAKLASELSHKCEFVNLKYTRLLTIVNTLPWVRTMTAKYIAARLETIGLKWPSSKIIVIAHSNGSVATSRALLNRENLSKNWPEFRLDGLVLLGCPIKRDFDWSKFPEINVINFVSSDDTVVFLASAYGMGSAGRFGFTKKSSNLLQIHVECGHSGFLAFYTLIRNTIKVLINPENPFK